MRQWVDRSRDGYVIEFEPSDFTRYAEPRLTPEEVRQFVRPLFVPRRDTEAAMLRGSLRDEQADRVYEHLMAAERHALCYRPGGYDANGAPLS